MPRELGSFDCVSSKSEEHLSGACAGSLDWVLPIGVSIILVILVMVVREGFFLLRM